MKKSILLTILALALILVGCEEAPTKSLNADPESFTTAGNQEAKDEEALPAPAEMEPRIIENNTVENLDTDSTPIKTLPSNKKEMSIEDIIIKYKDILAISDDYDEVSTEESSEMSGNKYYTINYYDTKSDESLWFSADVYGNLMSYAKYSEASSKRENNLSSTEAIDLVKTTLEKLYGPVAKDFIIEKNPNIKDLGSNSYNFEITRTVNNIKVPTDTISMEVSKATKSIISIYVDTASNYDFADTTNFENLDGIVSEEEGFSAFMKENKIYPLLLKIRDQDSYYLYEKYSLRPALGFIEKQIPVSAKDLKPYYLNPFMLVGYGGAKTEEAAMDSAGLSPVEQEHLDSIKDQYTLEDAEKKARSLFGLKDYKLSYSNFSPYRGTKGYNKWSLTFNKDDSYIYVSLLANDLSLLSYSNYEEGTAKDQDPASYLNTANDFIVSKAGMDPTKLTVTERSKHDQGQDYHLVEYHRNLEDGQVFYNDTATVNINKKTGAVEYFDKSWTYDLKEEKFDFAISGQEAYKKLKEAFGFELVYLRDGDPEENMVRLYYSLDSKKLDYTGIFLIDGQSGQAIGLDGKEILTYELVEYSDIESTRHPEIIRTLLDNNIGFPGGVLDGSKPVTQEELFRILLADEFYVDPATVNQDDIYKVVRERELLNGEDPAPEKIVKNRDYARYLARYLDYDEIGRNNQIFKDSYEDMKSSDPDYGYLVLAKLKKLIEFPSEDLLEPDKALERESFLYDYYYLKANY